MADIEANFTNLYVGKKSPHLYPTEFVIRAFLGSYPNLKLDKSLYPGRNILDLGYGDGRNMPLLNNLGLRIHGVEIDERINTLTAERMKDMHIPVELKLGTNKNIPYPDAFFEYVLACHACYYVEEGTTFTDNANEMARVMKKDGVMIASLPMQDGYILQGAEPLQGGHWRITNDPFGLRNGYVFRAFKDEADIEAAFSPHFTDFSIGFCDDFYWGIRQKVWIVVCKRR